MTEQAELPTVKEVDYGKQRAVRGRFAEYLKNGSPYQKHRLEVMPDEFAEIVPEVLHLYCNHCERENPFRPPSYGVKARFRAC